MRPSPASRSPEAADVAAEVTGLLGVLQERARGAAPASPVSASQMRALLAIGRLEGGNLRALGEALRSSPPATSRLCDRLEAAGLVERRLSPTSRRELELYLSRQGRALLEESRLRELDELRPVLTTMSPEEVDHLIKGLAAFRRAAAAVVDSGVGGSGQSGRDGAAEETHLRIARPA
ncbi:MarR family winged helix-turn-helix transcriptional regulator [Streptomyces sp. NPDC001691]|uniref:MarR family winged helix-turn-helix transcriptional regulator n=1 Tax=unclassified Streptomyces TaxID=2593676 RepID=UPI000DE84D31|nr:MarR family transcriptional regulator [Streptomyces sp. SDr-06]RCH67599.1 MarR family transcriptional regulator [Streptomyces sp. SDr-06]